MRKFIALTAAGVVACSILSSAFGAENMRATGICKIRNNQACQTGCAAPSTCLSNCVGCPSNTCAEGCKDWEFDDDGLRRLWKDLSPQQRELLLKGVTIEKRQ